MESNLIDKFKLLGIVDQGQYTGQVRGISENTRQRSHAHFIGSEKHRKLSVEAINNMHQGSATVDAFSKLLFKSAPDNVAFVGMYDTGTHIAYLHPLSPIWINNDKQEHRYEGNQEFDWSGISQEQTPQGVKRESFIHKAGVSPSHQQIADMYGVSDLRIGNSEVVGFSIIKRGAGQSHEFNAQSQTMNYFMFNYLGGKRPQNPIRGEDSYITKEWSIALMTLLSRELE